jgi:hypothetical protein
MKKPRPLAERFWKKVLFLPGHSCWFWVGARKGLYGGIEGSPPTYKSMFAHRVVWELTNGPIPHDRMIDHVCQNKLCVNPAHLRLVTGWQNLHESTTRTNAVKTHCKRGHPLSKAKILHAKDGYARRRCPQCANQRNRSWYDRQLRILPFRIACLSLGLNPSLVAIR